MADDWEERDTAHRASRKAAYRTVFWVVAPLLALMALAPLIIEQDWFEFRFRVLGLLLLGMVLTIGLAAGLMALSFHSSRSGIDDESGVLPEELDGTDEDR